MAYTNSVNRAALGNSASLGDLYDARRDDFCGISIFKKTIPNSAQTLIDAQFSDIHLVSTEDFSEKVAKLDVSAELQVSVLAGLFSLQGSGRYLSDQKTSARSAKSSLVYNIKTKRESVNIYHEDLKEAFSLDAIESGMATHAVVGIEWGANSIVTCQYENKENRDVREISGSLSAQLKKASLSISGKASVEFEDSDKSTGVKFDVRMYGDILPKNEELPTTFEGALELLKKLPSLVAASNDGKGKPLSYRLIPISMLKKYLSFEMHVDAITKSIEERSLVRVVQLFDQMSKAQQQLNDFYQDALEFRYCVLPEDLKKVANLKDETQLQETSFRSELCTVLTQIRSGKADVTRLEEVLETVQSSSVSPQMISTTLASWSNVITRINFVRVLVKEGATFVGFDKSLDEELLKNFDAKSYILYFSQNAIINDPERWGGNRQLFFQQMKNRDEGHRYFAVDCDINPNNKFKSCTSCVQVVQSGHIVVADLLAEQNKMSQMSYVQGIEEAKLIPDNSPRRKAHLTMVCPGKFCNRSKMHDWYCKKCNALVNYGLDQHVYCDCGMTAAICLEFKCSDPKHGVSYERHSEEYLQHVLSTLRTSNGLNILVLGKTAEKREAWIRELVAVLKYDSQKEFELAIESGSCRDIIDHQTNPESNIYLAVIGGLTIRFIDASEPMETAGMNLKKLLAGLTYLEEIHGICLLLNPSSPVAKDMFQAHCRQLTDVFGDGARNIHLFPVKDVEKFSGKAELAMLALKKLIFESGETKIDVCKETVYYLGATADSSTEKRINWEENVSEALRMMNYIRTLKPYPITKRIFVESDYSLSCKMAANRQLFVPIGNGLSIGDTLCFGGWPTRGYSYFNMAFFDNKRDYNNILFHLSFEPKGQGQQPVVVRSKGERVERETPFYPLVEEQPFQIKIICDRNLFRVYVDDRHWFNYSNHKPLSQVSYVEFNAGLVLTFLEITRAESNFFNPFGNFLRLFNNE